MECDAKDLKEIEWAEGESSKSTCHRFKDSPVYLQGISICKRRKRINKFAISKLCVALEPKPEPKR